MAEFSRRFSPVIFILLQMFLSTTLAQMATPAVGSAASTAGVSKGDAGSASGRSTDARTRIEDGATAHVETAPLLLFDGELKLKTPRGAEQGVVRAQNQQLPPAGTADLQIRVDAHEAEASGRK